MTDKPATPNDIEVTPEMIEAGLDVLAEHYDKIEYPDVGSREEVLKILFDKMTRAAFRKMA